MLAFFEKTCYSIFRSEKSDDLGGFPSGQRGQTVNLLQIASVVRIHLRPFCTLQWERAQECVTSILEACLQSACYAFLHRRIRRERENEVFECHAIRKYSVRRCGGIGRRKGLKIPRWQHRAGSSPATCSKLKMRETTILRRFSYFFAQWKMYVLVCTLNTEPYSLDWRCLP